MTSQVTVPSRTRADVEYRVTIGPDGGIACTCAGFEFRAACWHVDAVRGENVTSQALEVMRVTPPASILPSRDELSVIADIARSVIGARGQAVPASVDTPAKALAIMLAGHELGVRPMSALRHITVIGGRTEPDAQLSAGIVVAREPDASFEIIELTETKCTMRLSRPSRRIRVEYTYELKDAERAGLVKPGSNWQKFPKDMLRAACTKRLCRLAAPDLINAIGSVELTPMAGLLAEADPVPANLVDISTLPADQLYNDGDGHLIDPETGEVLEESATSEESSLVDAEEEAEPTEVIGMVLDGGALSRDVWTYVAQLLEDIAAKHFEGDWERVYAALGGHPESAPFFLRTQAGRPFIDPRGRTDDEAHALGELLQGWLNVNRAPAVVAARAARTQAAATATPRAPQARQPKAAPAPKDERLGEFENVGAFYVRANRELSMNGDRVREIAGLAPDAAPNLIVTFEGEAGNGLDALWLACATAAAGVVVD